MNRLTELTGRALEHRCFPLALALAAVVLMLPALESGLVGDDLVQRLAQFRPEELPSRIMDTGFVPENSGELPTVALDLFNYLGDEEAATSARDYGIIPWWTHESWRAALFRPLTGFTHWLDYRLFPNAPALMHAHNIAWYAAAIFLAAWLYRKIAGLAGHHLSETSESRVSLKGQPALWAAGLAPCLLLLDKNMFVPVMYVANRGFIISLVFGLLCLHAHLRWRTSNSRGWMLLSGLWLLLSLLANEGGASTLAFLMAYALVLEPGGWQARFTSLAPAAVAVISWRAVYAGAGFGVRNFLAYIDPGYEPWLFLNNLAPRASALLGGQLTGLPPELALMLNTDWQVRLAGCFTIFNLLCAMVFLPLLRQDPVMRFWAVVTLLAVVPAATVVPLSKNLGFVAVGAFGVIASFLVRLSAPQTRAIMPRPLRIMSLGIALWFVIAHIPGALAGRIALALVSPSIPKFAAQASALKVSAEIGERNVVVISDPTMITAMLPFDRAFRGHPLPRTIHNLVPGNVPFAVTRSDASTLILKTKEDDLFGRSAVGPIHVSYLSQAVNDLLLGGRRWKPGERVLRRDFVVEILEVSESGAPRAVAFQFGQPLESEEIVWVFFDWQRMVHCEFVLPGPGETVEVAGPKGRRKQDPGN